MSPSVTAPFERMAVPIAALHIRQHGRRRTAQLTRSAHKGITAPSSGVPSRVMRNTPTTAQRLRQQAQRCRRLAAATTDHEVSRRLLELAKEFDEQAVAEEARSRCP